MLRLSATLLGGWLVVVPASAPGQGTIVLGNYAPAIGLNAPVFGVDQVTLVDGLPMRFELLAGTRPSELAVVGSPSELSSPGYFGPATRVVPGVSPGQTVHVKVRAWTTLDGETFDEAVATGGRRAESDTFEVVAGGDTGGGAHPPTSAAYLVGLRPLVLAGQPARPRIRSIRVVEKGRLLEWEGPADGSYLVEVSDVVPPQWRIGGSGTAVGTTFRFLDDGRGLAGPLGPLRWYRLRQLPL